MLIQIDNTTPGMVLAEDIMLPSGAILVNSGQILSESLIQVLKKRGFSEIQVIQEEQVRQSEEEPETPENETDEHESRKGKDRDEGSRDQDQEKEKEKEKEEEKAPESRNPPSMQLFPADDLMSARIMVEPTDGPQEELDPEALFSLLAENGVTYGVDKDKIMELCGKWRSEKTVHEIDGIAKGVPPQPGREGEITIRVKHLTDTRQIEETKNATHFWQIEKYNAVVERVDPDTVIAEKEVGTPPIPGKNIAGEPLMIDEVVKSDIQIEENIRLSDDGSKLLSSVSGIVYRDHSRIGVIPVDFDAYAEVNVSPDNMEVEVSIHPPGEGGHPLDPQAIQSLLSERNISQGIDEKIIASLSQQIAKGQYPDEPVVVARGTPPKQGEDGKVEFFFNTESSLKPKVNPDGSVDYKSVDIVTTVEVGRELARLHPPTTGTAGTDVFGNQITTTDGNPGKLPVGTNTRVSPDDPDLLIAAAEGNVRYNGSVVEILEGYVIAGNVDFSTGNVQYGKSVTVNGDIKSGFRVECGADLQVGGTVEDAEITAGGNVLCKMGFLGQGRGVIDAHGSVNVGFIKNQTIKSRQNVVVAKEALNCTIFARKSIILHGNPLSVARGELHARDSMTLHTVGNLSGVRTMLECGFDYVLEDEQKRTDALLAEVTENNRKILDTLAKYERIATIKKQLGPKEQFVFTKLKNTRNKFQQQIKTLENRKEIIARKMYAFKNAYIRIEHAAMPGTIVKFGARHFLVRQEIIGPKTFRLINSEIRIL